MHYYFGSVLYKIYERVDEIRQESEKKNSPKEAKLVAVYEKTLSEAVTVVIKSLKQKRSVDHLSTCGEILEQRQEWKTGEEWHGEVSKGDLKQITEEDLDSLKSGFADRVEKFEPSVSDELSQGASDLHFPRAIVEEAESWVNDRARVGEWSPIGKFPVESDVTANAWYARAVCLVADELWAAARDSTKSERQPHTNKRLNWEIFIHST
nr:MAG: hypothetical protein J07AB56_05570 [Candidatus Nanosalinarum sp. J07AB56]